MQEVKDLNEKVNYQGSDDLVIHKGYYPVGNDENKDRVILEYMGNKVEKYGLPISVLLGEKIKYGMDECPSYVEFKLLVEEKSMRDGGRFLRQLIEIEEDILVGKTFKGVVEGMKDMNPIDIKGNQILNSMLAKSRKLDRLLDRAEKAAQANEADPFKDANTDKLLHIKNILEADWSETDANNKAEEGKKLAAEMKAKRLARKSKGKVEGTREDENDEDEEVRDDAE